MKIGFDGKRATKNFRGLGNYSRSMLDGLMQYSDNELFLYTPKFNNPRALNWVKKQDTSRFHVREPHTFIENLVPSLWRSLGVVGDIRQDNLDLYHGLSHEIPYGMKDLKTKTIVTIHDVIFLRYPEFFPLIDRINYKRKFTYAIKNADLVIAICEQTKKDIIELLGGDEKKIIVHYQSADPHFYLERDFNLKKGLMDKYNFERPFVLCVGAVEERKNQLRLIEAFGRISHKIEQDLVIIGQGKEYLESCKAKVSELNLGRRVHFLSNISFDELPLFYQTADLFCFPSHFEGFGIPIVEALFSKTPVVTSYGSCFPESAGPGSVYVDPLSVDDIAKGMLKVLENVELQNKMIFDGHFYAQQFTLENTTNELLKIYHSLF